MLIYSANNYHKDRLEFIHNNQDKLGLVFSPPYDYRPNYKFRYFLDNGAFSCFVKGIEWSSDNFLNLRKRFLKNEKKPDFIILPDIVAGGKKSLKRSELWLNILYDETTNYYLAVQDGLTPNNIKTVDKINGLFVGGTMEWKLKTAAKWVQFAHKNNLKCHIGRIGTIEKIKWAEKIKADSIDSSNFARHKYIWDELKNYLR